MTTEKADEYIASGGRAGAVPEDQNQEATTPYVSMEIINLPPSDEMGQDRPYSRQQQQGDDNDDVSISPSIVSSVMTADGIHDVPGFLIVCLVILVGDMSRGIFFPTMWLLVSDLGGTEVALGWAIAAFSFGRIMVNPMFGRWSVLYGYSKTMLCSCAILFVGTLLYAQAQNVGRPEFLVFAQTVLGIGSGTLGVTRAFVAEVTAKRTRTTYMAWITSVQYAGFTVTPFIGSLFTKIFGDYDWRWGPFRINKFTAPAYFMTMVIVITLYFIRFHFQDRLRHVTAKDPKRKSKRQQGVDAVANSKTFIGLSTYDLCILGCFLLNVATKGSIAAFETLGIKYAESHFDLYSATAGAIVATSGTLGVISLLLMGYLTQLFTDIQLITGGMLIMATGIISLSGLEEGADNPTWRYMLAIFLIYAIGYPIGHTTVIGLFSKIVGRRPQGELLGWFSSAGSAARILFPIMSGYVTHYNDITTVFYILTGTLVVATAIVLFNRSTLLLLSS